MNSGTTSAILLIDLLSGDGPHGEQADRFVAGNCIRCGRLVRAEELFSGPSRSPACATCRSLHG